MRLIFGASRGMELDPSKEDLGISITIARQSPTLNDCGRKLKILNSISLETQTLSNRLDPFLWEAGGTSDVIAVMESKRPNLQKDLAKLTDLVCSLESGMMISQNQLSFICSTKEIKSSLKDFLGQMFRLILVKYLLCWAQTVLVVWIDLIH